MKTIVLIALLAAAGCGGKKTDPSAETAAACGAAIGKGLDGLVATAKSRGSGAVPPQMGVMVEKLRTTYTGLCVEDKWSPEALACYGAAVSQPEFQKCRDKLTPEQSKKAMAKLREVMMGSMQLPPGMSGHPPMLQGSSPPPAAPPPATEGSAAAPAAGSGSGATGW
jgi:hypothetical protein